MMPCFMNRWQALLFIGIFIEALSQTRGEVRYALDSPYPIPGEPLLFRYEAPTAERAVLLVSTDLLLSVDSLPMVRENGAFRAVFRPDTATRLILFAFVIDGKKDDAHGFWHETPLYTSSRTPRRGAWQASALSLGGLAGRRSEDLDLALARIGQELEAHPTNDAARLVRVTLMARAGRLDDRARSRIQYEMSQMEKRRGHDAAFLDYAIQASRLIGDEARAQRYEETLLRRHPTSEAALRIRIARILSEAPDPKTRAMRLEALLAEVPQTRQTETLLVHLATAYLELGDFLKVLGTGDRLEPVASTPFGAQGLAGLAGWLAEKNQSLDRAESWIRKAIALLERAGEAGRPPEFTAETWRKTLRDTRAAYLDILGWICVQKGEVASGLTALLEAAEVLFQPGIFYHLAEAYARLSRPQEALIHYARAAAFGGEVGHTAYRALSTFWEKEARPQMGLDSLLRREERWVAETFRRRILQDQLQKAAPDFELKAVEGGRVRLSDQRGDVVLLVFWATWSRSSLRVLQALETLSSQYPEVLFLTVAMDPDPEEVLSYREDHDLRIPILFNDGLEAVYGLQGVPHLFLIDRRGVIRFEHRGAKPNLVEVLSVQLDALLRKGS